MTGARRMGNDRTDRKHLILEAINVIVAFCTLLATIYIGKAANDLLSQQMMPTFVLESCTLDNKTGADVYHVVNKNGVIQNVSLTAYRYAGMDYSAYEGTLLAQGQPKLEYHLLDQATMDYADIRQADMPIALNRPTGTMRDAFVRAAKETGVLPEGVVLFEFTVIQIEYIDLQRNPRNEMYIVKTDESGRSCSLALLSDALYERIRQAMTTPTAIDSAFPRDTTRLIEP